MLGSAATELTDAEARPRLVKARKRAVWVPSGLPRRPVDHDKARLAAYGEYGADHYDRHYGRAGGSDG